MGTANSSSAPTICAAERTTAARIGAILFRHRGWLPVIFLGIPLVMPGHMTPMSWACGFLTIVLGEAWRLWGIAAAGTTTRRRSRNVQRLVTYGAFAWSRNPLYNGNFLIWMGFTILSGVFWFLPVSIVLFAIEYTFIVRFEEGVLESTFGETYLTYKRHTPRWLPRPPSGVRPEDIPTTGPLDWREAWRSEISTFLQYVVLLTAFVIKMRLGS